MFGLIEGLEKRRAEGRPIRIAVLGAGGQGVLFAQSMSQTIGMSVDIICARTIEKAMGAMRSTGVDEAEIVVCETAVEAEAALAFGKKVVTPHFEVACTASPVEVVCEAMGSAEAYARSAFIAISNKKHFITMNLEADVCIGHIVNMWAKQAGVVYSGIYGDEPGNVMLQYHEARLSGLEVVAIGRSNMGGSDLKWNKESIKPVLKKMGISDTRPSVFASFCDGMKTNIECCVMANATGFRPDVRGMHCPSVSSWKDFATRIPTVLCPEYDGGILSDVGVVDCVETGMLEGDPDSQDYIWQFVIVKAKTPAQVAGVVRAGGVMTGDYGILYSTYHREAAQAPVTVALAVMDGRAVVAPSGNKRAADVVAMAKKDLELGEKIDEYGGFCITGRIECASVARKERLLPALLAPDAVVKRPVKQGSYLTYDDVTFPKEDSIVRELRKLQDMLFEDLW